MLMETKGLRGGWCAAPRSIHLPPRGYCPLRLPSQATGPEPVEARLCRGRIRDDMPDEIAESARMIPVEPCLSIGKST